MKKSGACWSMGAAILGVLCAGECIAHGIWFAERGGQTAIIYGVGADDLDSVGRKDSYQQIAAYDASYQPIEATLRAAGPVLLVDTDMQPTLLSVVLDNGTYSQDAAGKWEKGGRDVHPGAKVAETAMKYAVSIQGPLARPIPSLKGQVLQIVPVTPLAAKLGEMMTYRVLFKRGKLTPYWSVALLVSALFAGAAFAHGVARGKRRGVCRSQLCRPRAIHGQHRKAQRVA
jgi:nickel transport protein